LVAVGLACLALAACKKTPVPGDVAAIVPATGEVSGWARSGGLDTASTDSALSALLGASAQAYMDNEFASFCRQRFTGVVNAETVSLEMRVADMTDSLHARALFADLALPGDSAWTGDNPGEAARIRHDTLSAAIDFYSTRYYVWVSIGHGSNTACEAARYFALLAGHKADTTQPAPKPRKDVADLLPTDNEISGWTRTGAMQFAENNTQLEALIDGEAIPYEQNGFRKCAFQNYTGNIGGNAVEIDLRVFDQTDTTGAGNTYAAVAAGTEVPWTGDNPGREARTDESALFAYRVEFWQGSFYFRADIMDKSQAAQDVAKLFAFNVEAAIEDTTE
jgi:hypothetical protein